MRLNTCRILATVSSVFAFGFMVVAGEVRADSGPHPSVGHFSTEFQVQRSALENDFATLEIADIGGVGEEDSSDYLSQIQLAQVADDVNDPLESINRAVFSFNEMFYDGLIGPLADVYNVLPGESRTIVSSFLSNLSEPIVFINDVLQGEVERAMTTFTRFAMNSTFGFGGLADVASEAGVESHNEDFGQTLAVWGIDDGFYLVLPILGPSNPRDAIGQYIVDPMMDPLNIYLDNQGEDDWLVPRAAAVGFSDFASIRDELITLKRSSIDYYAAIRSLYRQKRLTEISNGSEAELPAIPDFEFSDFPLFDEPIPALGDTKEPDPDSDGEISAITESAFVDDFSVRLDPFKQRFEPENRHVVEMVVESDNIYHENAWQAQVISATNSR